MSISSSTCWEVRATGSDLSGGGFVAGATGTDRSQSDAAFAAGTGLAVDATTATDVLPDGHTPGAADVGNLVQVTAGAGFTAGFYQVVSIQAGQWRLDRPPAAAGTAGGTWALGGALATLGKLAGAMVASNKAFVKSGAYATTATVSFVQSVAPNTASPPTRIIGYYQVRGDVTRSANLANRPVLILTTNAGLTGLDLPGNGIFLDNLVVDCAGLGASTGIAVGGVYDQVRNCKVLGFTAAGISGGNNAAVVLDCEATGGTAAATAGIALTAGPTTILQCYVHDNDCPGIVLLSAAFSQAIRCLVANNAGASSDGIRAGWGGQVLYNTVHGSGRHGIFDPDPYVIGAVYQGNLLTGNGGAGLKVATANGNAADVAYDGNGYWDNTSGHRSGADDTTVNPQNGVAPYANPLDVTLTADPYVDRAAGDFRLNAAVGGGAACRGRGVPASWPGNGPTTAAPDLGAVQGAASAGGGGGATADAIADAVQARPLGLSDAAIAAIAAATADLVAAGAPPPPGPVDLTTGAVAAVVDAMGPMDLSTDALAAVAGALGPMDLTAGAVAAVVDAMGATGPVDLSAGALAAVAGAILVTAANKLRSDAQGRVELAPGGLEQVPVGDAGGNARHALDAIYSAQAHDVQAAPASGPGRVTIGPPGDPRIEADVDGLGNRSNVTVTRRGLP